MNEEPERLTLVARRTLVEKGYDPITAYYIVDMVQTSKPYSTIGRMPLDEGVELLRSLGFDIIALKYDLRADL